MGQKGRVFTGCRARFMIEGKKVGYATNVSGSEEVQYDPLEVLDNVEVEEFVPVAYRVTFTASLVRIVGETIKSAGWFPKTGTTTEDHLKNILLQGINGDMSAVIEDSHTGAKICTVEQMKMQSRNFTINARGMVGKDCTFVAIRMRDESEL
jgi:hypothetical protein